MVEQGIKSCLRGDVFQIVLSRRFQQAFQGDEFNVYRALAEYQSIALPVLF
jgi:anthranilate synthase component 1